MRMTAIMHPQDNFVMSHPAWEEYDGMLSGDELDIYKLREQGFVFPKVDDVLNHNILTGADFIEFKNKGSISFIGADSFQYLTRYHLKGYDKLIND